MAKMKEDGCDYDSSEDERLTRRLKINNLDIKAFEINSGGHLLRKSVEKTNLNDPTYVKFLKGFLSESEPSSSLDEGSDFSDEKNDMDPQYKMFLDNSKADGESYKLEIVTKNGMVSVMYERKDDFVGKCDAHSPFKLKNTINAGNEENEEIQNNGNKTTEVNVNKERTSKSEVAKNASLNPSRGKIITRSSPRNCNNMMDSQKNTRNKINGETRNNVKEGLRSRSVKDLKNISGRKEETLKSPKNSASKHVENTNMDIVNNRERGKRKSAEDKNLRSKRAKTNESSGKKSSEKRNDIFGIDWKPDLDANDVDECYRIFLNSIKIEGDRVVYEAEGLKPVKLEAFDVVCSYDSEVLVTNTALELNEKGSHPLQTRKPYLTLENEQQCHGGDCDSVFRKKLMDKLGEPYNEGEYNKLWDEFNKERPKVKHYDLRGSGAVKSFLIDELSPSYHATHALLSRKIVAAGDDHLQRLKYLRGFFFWLENVPHEDAFVPWLDKSCLEVMQKIC